MSTILKSLRKLEEEKSILDPRIDLKTMVIREDPRPRREPSRAKPLAWWGGLGLVGAGVALGGGVMLLMQPAAPAKSASGAQPVTLEAKVLPGPPQAGKTQALGGVPLSSIPKAAAVSKAKPAAAPLLSEISAPEPDLAPGAASAAPSVPEPATRIVEPTSVSPSLAGLPAGEEIVQALDSVPPQIRRTPPPTSQPQPVVEAFPPQEVPGLKVKGIIYFGEESPENYLFFTTPETGIQKLKVGEGVLDATLTGIQPGQAWFDYQGHSLVLRVGN